MAERDAPQRLTRRRLLTVVGAAATALLAPDGSRAAAPKRFEWRGWALGADACIILYERERQRAAAAIRTCVAEIERLESEFSLYRPTSALNRLNRDAVLDGPSHDMVRLLTEGRRFGEITGGAFDFTVQPLWRLFAGHFAANPAASEGPPAAVVDAALTHVDYRKVEIAPDRVRLEPGAAVTLNGIAQGYITDRVADVLRRRGWSNVLVNLGEIRALDGRPDGTPWRIGLKQGGPAVPLDNRAVATSMGSAAAFDAGARHHHLFDPRTGGSSYRYRGITVVADDATTADALSTAFSSLSRSEIAAVAAGENGVEAWIAGHDGTLTHVVR